MTDHPEQEGLTSQFDLRVRRDIQVPVGTPPSDFARVMLELLQKDHVEGFIPLDDVRALLLNMLQGINLPAARYSPSTTPTIDIVQEGGRSLGRLQNLSLDIDLSQLPPQIQTIPGIGILAGFKGRLTIKKFDIGNPQNRTGPDAADLEWVGVPETEFVLSSGLTAPIFQKGLLTAAIEGLKKFMDPNKLLLENTQRQVNEQLAFINSNCSLT